MAKAWQNGGTATAWATGLVPLQELIREPEWSPNGDLKASYGNGWIRTTSLLPDAVGQGEVRFADGRSMPVPVVGAQTAYKPFPSRTGPCPMTGQPPTCQWLTITGARLSTMEILTTRGQAIVPAWRYTVAGLTQPLMSVAVAPSAITPIPRVTPPELVVVGGSVTLPDAGTACTAQLLLHRVEVLTTQPVGTRPVVDALSSQPVLTQPTPLGQ